MSFFIKLIFALLSGIALAFVQAPYDLWFLIFPCFGLFYFFYQSLENKKQVFLLSFIFALGYFVTGLNWIGNALLVEGNDYKWVWPLAVIALPTLLSLFTALFLTINHILFKNENLIKFIGFCLFLSLSEWVRGFVFTGFPWNLYGYGLASVATISQSLSIVGPYGLTLFTIIWGGLLGYLFTDGKYKAPLSLVVILSFVGTFIYGHQKLKNADVQFDENINVHIIQPNIAQEKKWQNEELANNFEKLTSTLQGSLDNNKKHIVIWPETAIPPILLNNQTANQRIRTMLGDNAILLSGALTMQPDETTSKINYYNALLTWTKNKRGAKLYAKSHLVPFGEYIPFQKFIPLPTVTQFSGFKRGSGPKTINVKGYPSFTPLICYEIIFPQSTVNNEMVRPDYILTITNDAWYGDSAGPHQHFAQARFRAIEQGIPVLRSANTGISGIIDPYGRVIAQLELLKQGSIENTLPKALKKPTIYSLYNDFIYIIFSSICLFLCLFFRGKRIS